MNTKYLFPILVIVLLPLGLPARIKVGPNVQVSKARPRDTHYEVLVAADPQNPLKLITGSIVYPDRGVPSTVVYTSLDGGKTWRPTLEGKSLAYTGDPAVAYGPDGTTYYTASATPPVGERAMVFYRSKDGGKTWEKQPPFTYSDREYITVDSTGGKYNGRIYVNGNNRVPANISDYVVFYSDDYGTAFHGPGTREGFGKFSAEDMGNAVISSDGTLFGVFSEAEQLKMLTSVDGGKSLTPAVTISDYHAGGSRKGGHNNANNQPLMAIDSTKSFYRDRLYVVWPDRRSGHSEIFFSYSADKGTTWSKARAINDNLPSDTTDQFMPTVAVNKDGVLGVLWYDRRHHPDNEGWDARFTASFDGGETFLPSVQVSEHGSEFGPDIRWTGLRALVRQEEGSEANGGDHLGVQVSLNSFTFLGGDTAGLAADANGVFHPVWVDNRTGTPQIWTAPVTVSLDPVSLRNLSNISDKVTLDLNDLQYRRDGELLGISAQITNKSDETLLGPFKIHITELQSDLGDLVVLNADNGTDGIRSEWIFDDKQLLPRAKTQQKVLRFHLSDLHSFRKDDRFRLGLLRGNVIVLGKIQ